MNEIEKAIFYAGFIRKQITAQLEYGKLIEEMKGPAGIDRRPFFLAYAFECSFKLIDFRAFRQWFIEADLSMPQVRSMVDLLYENCQEAVKLLSLVKGQGGERRIRLRDDLTYSTIIDPAAANFNDEQAVYISHSEFYSYFGNVIRCIDDARKHESPIVKDTGPTAAQMALFIHYLHGARIEDVSKPTIPAILRKYGLQRSPVNVRNLYYQVGKGGEKDPMNLKNLPFVINSMLKGGRFGAARTLAEKDYYDMERSI